MEAVKRKILVVDDEPGLRTMLSYELAFLGYETVTAESGDEALLILQKNKFDLLITDVRMPGKLDGIDLVEEQRKTDPAFKAIFITGFALEEKLGNALKHPQSVCLKKPFGLDELTQALGKFLQ